MDIEEVIDVCFCMILASITLAIIDDMRCILPARRGAREDRKCIIRELHLIILQGSHPRRPQAKLLRGYSQTTFYHFYWYKNEHNCSYASMLLISLTPSITRSLKQNKTYLYMVAFKFIFVPSLPESLFGWYFVICVSILSSGKVRAKPPSVRWQMQLENNSNVTIAKLRESDIERKEVTNMLSQHLRGVKQVNTCSNTLQDLFCKDKRFNPFSHKKVYNY